MADHAYILCHFAHNSSLYTSWLEQLRVPYTIVKDLPSDWVPPADASIVITHMHYRWEDLAGLRNLQTNYPQLPLLVLADGILEYRNTWKNPGVSAGSMLQPTAGHKIACIGNGQARFLESWGNVGKCEVVGLPRLDPMLPPQTAHRKTSDTGKTSDTFRLVIATANTPAFDDDQHQTVLQSLRDLKNWLDKNQDINGRKIETTWRLTAGLDTELGLVEDAPANPTTEQPATKQPTTKNPAKELPLSEVFKQSDAVITTPSTMQLESSLLGLPTALLDYHLCPAYVPQAWTISAPGTIGRVIRELVDPPEPKLQFQDIALQDNLACRSPATERMVELIEKMIECGKQARADDKPVEYPHRIITDSEKGFFPVLPSFDLQQLFPNAASFANQDVTALQIELEALKARVDQLPKEVNDLKMLIDERNEQVLKYKDLLDASRSRREKMFADMQQLQARVKKLRGE